MNEATLRERWMSPPQEERREQERCQRLQRAMSNNNNGSDDDADGDSMAPLCDRCVPGQRHFECHLAMHNSSPPASASPPNNLQPLASKEDPSVHPSWAGWTTKTPPTTNKSTVAVPSSAVSNTASSPPVGDNTRTEPLYPSSTQVRLVRAQTAHWSTGRTTFPGILRNPSHPELQPSPNAVELPVPHPEIDSINSSILQSESVEAFRDEDTTTTSNGVAARQEVDGTTLQVPENTTQVALQLSREEAQYERLLIAEVVAVGPPQEEEEQSTGRCRCLPHSACWKSIRRIFKRKNKKNKKNRAREAAVPQEEEDPILQEAVVAPHPEAAAVDDGAIPVAWLPATDPPSLEQVAADATAAAHAAAAAAMAAAEAARAAAEAVARLAPPPPKGGFPLGPYWPYSMPPAPGMAPAPPKGGFPPGPGSYWPYSMPPAPGIATPPKGDFPPSPGSYWPYSMPPAPGMATPFFGPYMTPFSPGAAMPLWPPTMPTIPGTATPVGSYPNPKAPNNSSTDSPPSTKSQTSAPQRTDLESKKVSQESTKAARIPTGDKARKDQFPRLEDQAVMEAMLLSLSLATAQEEENKRRNDLCKRNPHDRDLVSLCERPRNKRSGPRYQHIEARSDGLEVQRGPEMLPNNGPLIRSALDTSELAPNPNSTSLLRKSSTHARRRSSVSHGAEAPESQKGVKRQEPGNIVDRPSFHSTMSSHGSKQTHPKSVAVPATQAELSFWGSHKRHYRTQQKKERRSGLPTYQQQASLIAEMQRQLKDLELQRDLAVAAYYGK